MTPLERATQTWHEINTRVGDASGNGNPADPHLLAALLDARAGMWLELGRLRGEDPNRPGSADVYAVACHYAAILDQEHAARVRYAHRIPTLTPGADHVRLHLDDLACRSCGQLAVHPGARCGGCPEHRYGVTGHNAEEAAKFGPGEPWTRMEPREDYDDA